MSEFYNQLAKTATQLIAKYGTAVFLKRDTGAINPVTGQKSGGSVQMLQTIGIFKQIPNTLIDGTRILSTDKMLVIDARIKPEITDTVQFYETTWAIEEITESNPGGTPLVYMLRIRR